MSEAAGAAAADPGHLRGQRRRGAPVNGSGNVDILVLAIMVVLSPVLLAVPFIPGLRSILRRVPLHRVTWRRYYHDHPAR